MNIDDGDDESPELAGLSKEFAAAANQMMPALRLLLVENIDPCDIPVDALFSALRMGATIDRELHDNANREGGVLHAPAVLSAPACAILRAKVDETRRTDADEVDDLPMHQLDLSPPELEELIGYREARRLWRLPAAYLRWKLDGEDESAEEARLHDEAVAAAADDADGGGAAAADGPLPPHFRQCFVRRYSPDSRPWFPFHPDTHDITINIELSPRESYEGGALLGVYGGEVRRIVRAEGDATVHDSKLLHAVSRMQAGTRHSLICFFGSSAK